MNNLSKEKKRVVISSDMNHNYSFLLPITAFLWSERIGYTPMIFLCGQRNKGLDFITKFIEDLKIDYEISHINSINGYTDQNVSQVCRLFAACKHVSPDTYMLIGDADMWPISRSYFHQQNLNKEVHLFGSNTSNHEKYPMCYIGMRANSWRNILDLNVHKGLEENIESKLDSFLGKNPSSDDGWYFDEKFFAKMVKKWNGYPGRCQMIERLNTSNGLFGRLDRGSWSFNGNVDGLIDSHILHSASQNSNWDRITPLLSKLVSPEKFEIFTKYKSDWDKLWV